MQFFPIPVLKILPAGLVMVLLTAALAGCHASTSSVEASTARNPVVAPAGTVLRVRLNQTLETGRSRPGDRFSGTLDAPVMAGRIEVLPKGTKVEGHIEPAQGLALALDSYQRDGRWYALSTNVVSRTGAADQARGNAMELKNVLAGGPVGDARASIMVPVDSIIGFTLVSALTA